MRHKEKKNDNKKGKFWHRTKEKIHKIKDIIVDDDVDNKASFSLLEVIVIILISILFGILIGYMITYSKGISTENSKSKVSEIVSTYHNIVNRYYKKVDQDKLADAAIKGMIDSLDDPYSSFMDESEAMEFDETTNGSFVGIGVVVQYVEDRNQIIEVYKDGPAEKAGLKVDDVILEVDGNSVIGVAGEDLVSLIRGEKGTSVVLKIQRGDQEKEFEIKRDTIELTVVSGDVISYNNQKIGYLKVSSFAANSYTQFEKELSKLKKEEVDSLIIDVRDNLGGHLLQTKQILSMFFPKKTVLYQIQSKKKTRKITSDAKSVYVYPIVVLINGGSASASEIFASCFQENYSDAIIVGTTSYGKGTVQKTQNLKDGNSIKYTTEQWLTSKGKSIEGVGVVPDVEVSRTMEYYDNPSYDTDEPLQEALRQLSEKESSY